MSGGYAELQVTSCFSFLRGGSHPEELVDRAAALGYRAIAITDRSSVAGAVRAHRAAREAGIQLLPGARLDLDDGGALLCLPRDLAAWGRLCSLLTLGKTRAEKGACRLAAEDLERLGGGQSVIAVAAGGETGLARLAAQLAEMFPGSAWTAGSWLCRGDDAERLDRLDRLGKRCGAPLVATGDVHYHDSSRRPLQEVLTCIREGVTLKRAGFRQFANAERHLRPLPEIRRRFAAWPEALERGVAIADASSFSLDELRYEYPLELHGRSPDEELAARVEEGARRRWPGGTPEKMRHLLDRELKVVAQLGYACYFLTVDDIVRFARQRSILCQGRGSAANSAICYCLGVTSVDPSHFDLLFERFVSGARGEPPDIDVDFEHQRREEVIQHVYERYGRDRAALVASVVTYRSRSAVREIGKVFGLGEDLLTALSAATRLDRDRPLAAASLRAMGLDPEDRRLAWVLRLARDLVGFPRHLSQHPCGFAITRGPLRELCPIANAAMEGRTALEWDKDDLDALGILKIDLLGLGMLTCIHKGLDLVAEHHGRRFALADVPAEEPAVYDMLCRADAVGVFQVESRAQMAMLPRLRPRCFYDLVIEVAIVRPGPIQGDMVHPYLRRRNGEERVSFPSAELEEVLGKTLGVPLFQEQAMRIAIVAAGFTPEEADGLRKAMASFRRRGTLRALRQRFLDGMVRRGYEEAFAERCFRQIEGFGDYGFPESHAASFAHLVYVSAWLKCRYPAAFACALLNCQPMGFYAPAQILRDVREHGIEVRPVDVNASGWDCTLEPGAGGPALRLGLRCARGLSEAHADRLVASRGNGYPDPAAVQRRAGLPTRAVERLAEADAFASLGMSRRDALWEAKRLPPTVLDELPLFGAGQEDDMEEEPAAMPEAGDGEEVAEDYRVLGFTLRQHPLELLRPDVAATPAAELVEAADGARLRVAGLVTARQRPHSASGVMFMTIEDETGVANVIVWPRVLARFRREAVTSRMVAVRGRLQRQGIVTHLIADRIEDLSPMLDSLAGRRLQTRSRDFH